MEGDIKTLGLAKLKSPNELVNVGFGYAVDDAERLLISPTLETMRKHGGDGEFPGSFELAGPRQQIYFAPARTKVAIVTCGGLCPGINAVIRALVMELWYRYGVKNIVGVPFGYWGLSAGNEEPFTELTPSLVTNIHEKGGTILGSSRGAPSIEERVDILERYNINILFTIGGDGTMAGCKQISDEIEKRGLKIGVVGIPKTIDNDIVYVKQSFGFESAVDIACNAVEAAHYEAEGAKRGIGLVKLMGRDSGYIAANTTLATGHVNICLIPEVPFSIEGEDGVLSLLDKRLDVSNHAVVVVAEGAGQEFFEDDEQRDASGNKKLIDVGEYLKEKIISHFEKIGKPVSLKYIDPSYIIRSTPANPADRLFCAQLAQSAVHAAMAGKTSMMIGYWHGMLTHVPLELTVGKKQTLSRNGEVWFRVLETTGQPARMGRD